MSGIHTFNAENIEVGTLHFTTRENDLVFGLNPTLTLLTNAIHYIAHLKKKGPSPVGNRPGGRPGHQSAAPTLRPNSKHTANTRLRGRAFWQILALPGASMRLDRHTIGTGPGRQGVLSVN